MKRQGKTDHYNEEKERKRKRENEREKKKKRWLSIVENGKREMSITKEKEKASTDARVVRGKS